MPAGRSGHAGAVLDGCWYLAGGGDNKRALTDTLVLELRAPSGTPWPLSPCKMAVGG